MKHININNSWEGDNSFQKRPERSNGKFSQIWPDLSIPEIQKIVLKHFCSFKDGKKWCEFPLETHSM